MQPFSCISVVGGRYLLNLQACAMFANSAVDKDRQIWASPVEQDQTSSGTGEFNCPTKSLMADVY
jgi:hypothetical protein